MRRGIYEKITARVDFLKPRTLYYSEEKIFDSGEIFQIHRGPRWRIFQRGTTFFPPRQYSATQLDSGCWGRRRTDRRGCHGASTGNGSVTYVTMMLAAGKGTFLNTFDSVFEHEYFSRWNWRGWSCCDIWGWGGYERKIGVLGASEICLSFYVY